MIEQIIEMRDRKPDETTLAEGGMKGTTISSGRGELTKQYEVKGAVNETAEMLDKILLSYYGFDAPYVKAFPYANQIIVTGKPEHFKMVETWIEKFEKEPVQPKYVFALQPLEVSPERVLTMFQQSLSPDQQSKVNIAPVPGLGRRSAMQALGDREVKWDSPIVPTTQPAASATGVRPVSASPFVPTNELASFGPPFRP